MAKALDLTVTPWGALGFGLLTGKYHDADAGDDRVRLTESGWGTDLLTERNLAIGREVVAVAEELHATPAQVSLAWLRQREDASILPILGARHAGQLRDSLGCLDLEIPDELMAKLDEASAVSLGFPHEFLASPNIRDIVYGDHRDSIG
jgi:aryl-alcohol dehydrogenase-like predicted oxidoreductase